MRKRPGTWKWIWSVVLMVSVLSSARAQEDLGEMEAIVSGSGVGVQAETELPEGLSVGDEDPALQRKREYLARWNQLRQKWSESRDLDHLTQEYGQMRQEFADQATVELEIAEHLVGVLRNGLPNDYRRSTWLAVVQRSVESVVSGPAWAGGESVDLAFRAASALRGLATGCLSWAPEVSQQCYRQIGVMAQRVQQNPKFPSQNRPALAPWLWDEARGWALAQQSQPAMEALRRALEWGLVDFEEVLEDELLQGLSNHEAIAALVKNARSNYENRMRLGIGNAIQTFRSFPFRFSCNSLTNARVTESHFQGKWLVVDLWGTWCVPCRAEVPHLKRLQREFASQGWEIVGIAIEQGATEAENRKLVQEFVDQQSIPYACLLGDAELLQQIPQQKSLPTLVFINPQGKVVFSAQGYHDYTQLKVILETLQKSAPKSRAN